jgi:hypothetical protein
MIKYLFAVLGMSTSAVAQIFLKKASAFSFQEIIYYIYVGIAGIFY